MRILGLDFGSKTVGVAVSDALLITAQGVEIIRRKAPTKLRQTLARIEQLVSEYEVEKIVLGYPKNMNSTEGERCEKTKEFKEMLEKRCGLPVILWHERLTTVAADRSMMVLHPVVLNHTLLQDCQYQNLPVTGLTLPLHWLHLTSYWLLLPSC